MSLTSARDAAQLDQEWGELLAQRAALTARLADAERRWPGAEQARDAAQARVTAVLDAAGGGWGVGEAPSGFLEARDAHEAALGVCADLAVTASQARQGLGHVADELERVAREAEAEVTRATALLAAVARLRTRLKAAAPAGQQSPRG